MDKDGGKWGRCYGQNREEVGGRQPGRRMPW